MHIILVPSTDTDTAIASSLPMGVTLTVVQKGQALPNADGLVGHITAVYGDFTNVAAAIKGGDRVYLETGEISGAQAVALGRIRKAIDAAAGGCYFAGITAGMAAAEAFADALAAARAVTASVSVADLAPGAPNAKGTVPGATPVTVGRTRQSAVTSVPTRGKRRS